MNSELKMPVWQRYVWSDWQCVLSWIDSTKQLSVFVKNRVEEIRSHWNIVFRYVKTSENPADIALVLKFIRKLKKCDSSKGYYQNAGELIRAETLWLKAVQSSCCDDVLKSIKCNKRNNIQRQLGLYIDPSGLLRCQGQTRAFGLK